MPRIVGVDVPPNKRVKIALTYIYGVGRTTAEKVCKELGFQQELRAKDLTEEDIQKVAHMLEKSFLVEGSLRRQTSQNIQRLKDIRCYRGIRHMKGLPVRGQNTQSNARTRKGPRKTVAGKKSVKALG
ncbi:MAG: 30S ribosomal protein S13 [Planctomycetes bacterium]|jgi:small subunit ribosomal protein S13|nr:30S ribosomal protein S13 [Planctomycetota bacterium]